MKKIRFLILISIVLIGGVVFVTLWVNLTGEKVSKIGEDAPKISTDGADARLEKIRFVEDKQGQRTWELEAKSIQQYQDENIMLVEKVKVTLFTKEGRVFVISGNEGKVYEDSKNMELVGEVVLTSSDGYRLKTNSIHYHHSERKITTSDPVEIEGEQIQVAGKGMWVDMEARIFRVLEQVKTRWKGEKRG